MPRDKATSKADEVGFRAMDEDMGDGKSVTAMWARGIVPCARSETIGVIGMEAMPGDESETRGLEIT